MKPAIKIEHLSKKYIIRHEQQDRHVTLRDVIATGAKRLVQTIKHPLGGFDMGDPGHEEFWALDDVSIDIMPGERMGIVGRNGAGKSTLLKILSRITEPTKGSVQLGGRVASLLEVGTGFHAELTGRENIFLNGAILGMSKAEIRRKFDAIVEFAEVEKFLDTPVKRYSSGMYVRLAFGVAAHLESDILIVDEVLAVGDAEFQKKCMGKMESVASEGRTILFVSHNMGAIATLCDRAVLLERGKKILEGNPPEIINAYMGNETHGVVQITPRKKFPIYVTSIRLMDEHGSTTSSVSMGSDATVEIHYEVEKTLRNVTMGLLLHRHGIPLMNSYDKDIEDPFHGSRSPGKWCSRIRLPLSYFKEGRYTLEVNIGANLVAMSDEGAILTFDIHNDSIDTYHKSFRADRPGHLYWPIHWQTDYIGQEKN